MRRLHLLGGAAALALALGTGSVRAQDFDDGDSDRDAPDPAPAAAKKSTNGAAKPRDDKKFKDFDEVTRGSRRVDGLFTLHRKDEHLYAEIRPNQFDEQFLVPIAIARGLAMAGRPVNFGDEWVISFHRAGDKVQVIRRNIYYKAQANSPLEKAVKQNYTDSVLLALPIVSINPGSQSVVIDFADIFLTDFAQLNLGFLDRNRTTWSKVKGFPNNLEIEVEATFGGGFHGSFHSMGGDGSVDGRGRTVVIHYSLAKMPDSAYRPRFADDRVGHFLNSTKDFGSGDPETSYVRMINRWRLEKADHKAKLSPPKKQIVWYVEDTVPHEYRPAVEEGIREWNKAFEKIGFRDAMSVRWQDSGRDEFDPEDINYCTFRWITTSETFAMSCLRSNPVTGEMIDGDVIFDASWIKHWKQQYAFLTGNAPTAASPAAARGGEAAPPELLAVGRVLSPILASQEGFGLPQPLPGARASLIAESARTGMPRPELVPAGWNETERRLRQRQGLGQFSSCQLSFGMRPELGLAALALAADEKDKNKDKKDGEVKLPDELINQLIKEVVMHEVGHSLGLRHNFKASSMLSADQLHDTSITRVKGMSGSVMDYNPVNLAPRGHKQGDYTTTTIGPYDYWAIEYAYKPVDGDEAAELKKIAARSPEPDLVFATDEDMYLNHDPLVNVYDLGSDTLRFAKDRISLASDLMKDLDSRAVKDGDSYSRAREAFSYLMNQWGNSATLASAYVGGQLVARDHKGKGARDPVAPVPAAKQREALEFLVERILSDKAFKFSPTLLRRLAAETWHDGGNSMLAGGEVDYPLNQEVLGIQKIALNRCLSPGVLSRLENQEALVDSGADAFRASEVFRALTNGIWSELSNPDTAGGGKDAKKDKPFALSTLRRNLQREHLRRLGRIALGNRQPAYEEVFGFMLFSNSAGYPADARSLARMHLGEISAKLSKLLHTDGPAIDDTTRAHLEECRFRISKLLDANVQAVEP